MATVLVTGIGGGVGQGILRNLREVNPEFVLIGTNVNRVSGGNYLCHKVYEVPYAYDENYIDTLLGICARESVDLIIPSTDYESHYLSASSHLFECKIAASPPEVTSFCLDKYSTWQQLSKNGIPFAPSYLPSEYGNQFTGIVVKPREGRGSRNIYFNPNDIANFDDSYVVQELLKGKEITTAFYVRQSGELHGMITFERELEAGNTSKAEVVFSYEPELEVTIKKLISAFPFRGSCNLQSMVTTHGIIPFEINCRISGTNSIRSQFGFRDVAYTVQEHLHNAEPEKPCVVKGACVRIMLDLIYPGISLQDINNNQDHYFLH